MILVWAHSEEMIFFGFFRKANEIWRLITGWGLDHNVKEAYKFLVENYRSGIDEDCQPDKIYIFGFSQGAYAARVLAGLLRAADLIEKRNINLLDYIYRDYKLLPENATGNELRLYHKMLQPKFPEVHFLGLFDTVSSVIE